MSRDMRPACPETSHYAPEWTRTSTRNFPTRPSTLRVYQFRHRRRGASIAAAAAGQGGRCQDRTLHPSSGGATVRTHVRHRVLPPRAKGCSSGPDQAPAGDLRLHQDVLRRLRVSADGARHRQGGRPDVVLDGPRAPGEPREARAAAPRPVQAARDRAARPSAWASAVGQRIGRSSGPTACRSSAAVAAGQPILAEENIEEYVAVPPDRRRRRRRVRPARPRRLDDGRRHPRGRLRRRPPAGDRRRRRDRRRAASGRRRRSSASSANPTTSACSPRTRRWSRSAARTSGARPRRGPAQASLSRPGRRGSSAALLHRSARTRYVGRAGQAAAGAMLSRKVRTSQGRVVEYRPGETRGKVPQKQTANVRRPT